LTKGGNMAERGKGTNERDIRHRLADLLDRVLVRAENATAVQGELMALSAAPGNAEWSNQIARAMGVVGLINASADGTASRNDAFAAVTRLKQELRTAAAN
jgi:hypothetical protein